MNKKGLIRRKKGKRKRGNENTEGGKKKMEQRVGSIEEKE